MSRSQLLTQSKENKWIGSQSGPMHIPGAPFPLLDVNEDAAEIFSGTRKKALAQNKISHIKKNGCNNSIDNLCKKLTFKI